MRKYGISIFDRVTYIRLTKNQSLSDLEFNHLRYLERVGAQKDSLPYTGQQNDKGQLEIYLKKNDAYILEEAKKEAFAHFKSDLVNLTTDYNKFAVEFARPISECLISEPSD